MDTIPSGTVTFLFTDIEGSTALAQHFPDALPGLLGRHHSILQQSIQASNGTVFQIIGDAFCAAFHTASDALMAGLAAQRSLQHEAWVPAPVAVRMGIHTGVAEAEIMDDRSVNYRGYLTLARVQSVMSGAHGGQVLLSSTSAGLVQDQLPQGVILRDMGEHHLKGDMNREHLWQLVADDLRSEFPSLRTLNEHPNNLPVQLNSFVGRERELAQTKDLLSATHLLTLIGPGGTGKTRMAVHLAGETLPAFTDGAWLVELAPLADPALVLQTVAATLGLRENPGTSLEDLAISYLRTKRILLILDNCEHLVETCAQLADHLLRNCSHLKMIASSREALGITGETVYRVPPLALPDSDDASLEILRRSEAVQLFIERALAARPGFALTGRNGPAVAQICRRLDGIPLALELAAARVGMLTPEQIATRLDDRFRLLTGGSRTALPRQQTLRSLIDWSYDLLSEAERLLFCQLSVFVGDWSLEAAEAVCTDLDVLELLAQLVKKSLVVADEGSKQAETRFRLLETIRQYARDKLLETGAAGMVRDRHLDYYLKFAEAGEFNIYGPQRLEWVDRCEMEHDNFRAALQWGLDHDVEAAMRLGGALAVFWGARGFLLEGRRWLQAALDRAAALPEPGDQALRQRQAARAKGLMGFSQMSYGSGDYPSGLNASQEALRFYRETGDWFNIGFALGYIGNMAAFQNDMVLAEQALTEAILIGREHKDKLILDFALGVMSRYVYLPRGDIEMARACAEESGRYSRELGLTWGVAQTELILARIASIYSQWDEARRHARAAVEVYQELRDPLLLNMSYHELGDIELRAGNLAEARRYLQNCILVFQELGQQAFVAHELESFAFIAQADNQPARAARLLGAAEAVQEGIGTSAMGVERLKNEYNRAIAWLHTQLDETAYDACWSEGCAMTMEQAISYALQE
jgi:predicted ATPase/class 3 adenylate cyclase